MESNRRTFHLPTEIELHPVNLSKRNFEVELKVLTNLRGLRPRGFGAGVALALMVAAAAPLRLQSQTQ